MTTNNNIIRAFFYSEAKDTKAMLSYILHYANNNHFFNPELNSGGLFDLYEEVMTDYNVLTGEELYNHKDLSEEMELFYSINEKIDNTLKDVLDTMLEENINYANALKVDGESAQIYADLDEEGEVVFVLDFPIKQVNSTDEKQLLFDSHKNDENDKNDNNHNKWYDTMDVKPNDGPQQTHAMAVLLFDEILQMTKKISMSQPDMFFSSLTRLQGANEKDLKLIHEQIIAIIEVIQVSEGGVNKPHWTEIIDFAYDNDGNAIRMMTDYLAVKHEEIADGNVETITRYDAILELQRHIASISPIVPMSEATPLSNQSHLLLAFIDYIGDALGLLESGFFDE